MNRKTCPPTARRFSSFISRAAHTDGDSVVFFRRSDVVVTGDIFDLTSYPVIDAAKGGRFTGVIAG